VPGCRVANFGLHCSTGDHEKRSALPKGRCGPLRLVFELFLGVYGYHLPTGPSFEGHDAVNGSEEGVVPTLPDVSARMEFGAPLPDDDAASQDLFAPVALHSKSLRVAVPTVSARAYTLFMCHRCPLLSCPAGFSAPAGGDQTRISSTRISVNPCRCPCLRR
jgi:hypothetical protein